MTSGAVVTRLSLAVVYVDGTVVAGVTVLTETRVSTEDKRGNKREDKMVKCFLASVTVLTTNK